MKKKIRENEERHHLPMSFSSNGTFSLCSKVEGEVVGSCPTGCVTNQKKERHHLRPRRTFD
jgi:hypothetical protein